MRRDALRHPMILYILPHDNCTWEAKLKPNTIGGAVSSAGETQTETRRVLMTSERVRSGHSARSSDSIIVVVIAVIVIIIYP